MIPSSQPESFKTPGEASSASPAVLAGKKFGVWHYIWKLLRLRWVIFLSGFKRSKPRHKIGLVIISLFVIGLAAILYLGSWALLGLLQSSLVTQMMDPAALIESMPAFILSFAFLAVLLTNFGVLLQALYLAGDMDFLLSAPLPMRAVFFTKLLQAILPNFGLVCLFSLPVLFGLGVSSHYEIPYFIMVIITLAALTLVAGGISGVLVMAVVRVIPAKRIAEVLGFAGVILSIFISQSGRLFSDVDLSNSQLVNSLGTLVKINTPFSPLAWAGRGLVDLGKGQWLGGIGWSGLVLVLAFAIFWFALSLAERLYFSGWARLQASPRKKKKSLPRPENRKREIAPAAAIPAAWENAAGAYPARRFISPAFKAMLWKDFTLVRRDLRNLSQFVTPLILGVVVMISMARTGSVENRPPEELSSFLINFKFYGSLAFILFIGWSLILPFTIGSFSREGKSYWLVKVSPIRIRYLLVSKFLVSLIPSMIFEWLLLVLIQVIQQGDISLLAYGFIVTLFYVAGSVGINLAFGVVGARLDWQDPRQMNSTRIGCLGTMVSFIYLPISMLFFFLPVLMTTLLRQDQALGQLIGLALGGAFSAACAFLPPFLVRKRVARIGLK